MARWAIIIVTIIAGFQQLPVASAAKHCTEVSIRGESFLINSKPTYNGRTWKGNWQISTPHEKSFFGLVKEIAGQ